MILSHLRRLPSDRLDRFLRTLIPEAADRQVERLRQAGRVAAESADLQVIFKPELGELKLRMPERRVDGDYAFLLDLDEHGLGEIELSFVQMNDLFGPRYRIDVDELGRPTLLGTARRNIAEEVRAMQNGLGPGQVRHGLGAFADFFTRLVEFARQAGYVNILLEPLTYHNALMYERHGFVYSQGLKVMRQIDEGFQPGGVYIHRLDDSTPFRRRGSENDQRMRSWAIHDGILGHPLPQLRMVYVIGGEPAPVVTFHASGRLTGAPPAVGHSAAARPGEGP